MSCLNLGRVLLPTRKLWKLFSTKLQINFHKVLNRSKVIKKSKNPYPLSTKKKLAPSSIFRVQFKTKSSNTKFKYKSKSRHHKKPAPVYIDELFIENISVVKENFAQTTMITKNKEDHKKVLVTQIKQAEIYQGESSGTNGENYSNHDEMWESLTLASPQLDCINERAEEFITRFRADMQRQQNLLTHRL
ncbi:unnamed protein product [Withania somnifera]